MADEFFAIKRETEISQSLADTKREWKVEGICKRGDESE